MKTEEQHDNHCWLVAGGSSWKIRMAQSGLLYLWRGYHPTLEYAVLDVSHVKMEEYCEQAVKILEEAFPDFRAERVH